LSGSRPSDHQTDDATLLERARAGDRAAFGELVDRHKDTLVGYLTRLVGSPDRAEDLAQEAFLRLYEHRHRYVEQGSLLSYLYTIATNLVRSEERQRKRRRVLRSIFLPSNGHGAHAEQSPQQQSSLLVEELQAALGQAVASLPVHYRVPLVLHEIEGWSYKRIGALSQCREGTVKSRIYRGRQLLKQKLGPYWRGEPAS
jgi:RNA polymerase sigma-70 factor (ECF subfamily)